MAKEKTEEISDVKSENSSEITEIAENDELLKLAFQKANEKKIPIILWEKKDENKEFLFQIISHKDNIVQAFMIGLNGKKSEVEFQIKPSSLNSQLMKFGIYEKSIFSIKYMGMKKSPNSEFEFKSFIVRKFDPITQLFYTTKMLE